MVRRYRNPLLAGNFVKTATMAKFSKILGITVSILFILLGVYLLASPRFASLTMQIRVIFAAFLFLYGAWRLTRYIYKRREED